MEFEVPSNSWSGIGGIGIVWSLWTEVNTESRKQCVEPESTRVGMVIPRKGQCNPGPVPEPKGCYLFFWLLGRGAVVWGFLRGCGTCFSGCGGGLQTFFGDMTGFAAEQA